MTMNHATETEQPGAALLHRAGFSDANTDGRDVPDEARVLVGLAKTAWQVVERLAEAGAKFPGTVPQAAAVVVSTAYAGWRASRDTDFHRDDVVAHSFAEGLLYSLWQKDAMPAGWRRDYLDATAGSAEPIDCRPLRETLGEAWPSCRPPLEIPTSGRSAGAAGADDGTVEDCYKPAPLIFDDIEA
jgi:hypothetical protein